MSADMAATLGLPQDAGGPVFREPWEASAFALAVALHDGGHLTWEEWTQALAAELAVAPDGDDAGSFYVHWLAALERLVAAKGL